MVAFVGSILVAALMTAGIAWYGKRRPVDKPLTWGEAMVAATYVFFLMFWSYGVIPDRWLAWADNELRWRSDKLVFGPGEILKPQAEDGWLPFTLTWQTIRDIIATGIYGVVLAGNVAAVVLWQKRGKKAQPAIERSEYGRPLVREGV
ncbi:MAG TPA: hypothetical protein VF183_15600 [Acidimicrobiales bacterium]